MGKLKSLVIALLSLSCPLLICGNTGAEGYLLETAYLAAGIIPCDEKENTDLREDSNSVTIPVPENTHEVTEDNYPSESDSGESDTSDSDLSETGEPPESSDVQGTADSGEDSAVPVRGKVIELNRSNLTDDTDYSAFTEKSGDIYRYNYGRFSSTDYINLPTGAQVRNCTDLDNEVLEKAAAELPDYGDDYNYEEPQVLIYHTHTCESFLPFSDTFDENYPIRSVDSGKNITAVGDAICESLAERGISVVHDCRVHDYPMYTGAYYRSADSVLEDLEKYPGIKLVIDVHRDGIINEDGSLYAPVTEIDGKNAAQFMIISCCDNGDFDMPDYMENFKLACLLQNCSEKRYPRLARPVLFDYRNYNQSLSTGALLIEVGSHGNSLDEAVYTGKLLGNVIADSLDTLKGPVE